MQWCGHASAFHMIGYCVLLDKIDYLADIGNEVWTLIGVTYEKTILSTHFCLFKWFYSVHTGAVG